MPKKYPADQKREAIELLGIYDKVSTVRQLTGIPLSTLYRWRDQQFSQNADLSVKKDFEITEQFLHKSESSVHTPTVPSQTSSSIEQPTDNLASPQGHAQDSRTEEPVADTERSDYLQWLIGEDDPETKTAERTPKPEPEAGVPGKTYPYPLEDDNEKDSDYEAFRKLRDLLMAHAQEMATNLNPADSDINLRTLALARILDRVQQLDDLLPDLNPEPVMRFEYVYDGMVHNVPPWKGTIKDQDKFREEMNRMIEEEGVV